MVTLRRTFARWGSAVAGYARRRARRTRDLVTDPAARPAMLYLLALGIALSSFLLFLVGGGGTPSGLEFGLLMSSFGVVLYMSLRQAGTAPGRGRGR